MEGEWEAEMRTPADEREVIVRFYTDEQTATVYTSDYNYMRKFDRLVEENPDVWKFTRQETCQGDVVGKFYGCPKKMITFRAKKPTREMTEEQKKELNERLARMRDARRKN